MIPSTAQEVVAFVFFAAFALLSAIATVTLRNPIRNAVGLFVHMLSLAGLYITLSAHFLVAVQLIVYVGAVVVLFVFVIMLLGPGSATAPDASGRVPRILGAASAAVVGLLIASTVRSLQPPRPERVEAYGTIKHVGEFLFGPGMIPFEVVSVLLTAAVIGAFAVARAHHHKVKMSTETNPHHLHNADEAPGDRT